MGLYCGKQKQPKSRKPAYRSKRKAPPNNVVPEPPPLLPPEPPLIDPISAMQGCHDQIFASVEVVNGNIMHHVIIPAMPEIYDPNMMHIEANLPNAMPLQQIMVNRKSKKQKGAEHRLERKRRKKKKGAGTALEITMKKKRRKKKTERRKKRRRSSQSNSISRSYNSSHLDSSLSMHFPPSYSCTSETMSEYSSNGESNRIPVDVGYNDYNVSSVSALSDYGIFLPPQGPPQPHSAVPYSMHASSPQFQTNLAKSQSLHSASPAYSFSAPPRAGKVRRAQTLSYDMSGMDLARRNSYHLGLHE